MGQNTSENFPKRPKPAGDFEIFVKIWKTNREIFQKNAKIEAEKRRASLSANNINKWVQET